MGRDPAHEQPDESADAVVHADKGTRLQELQADDGAPYQFIEQHDLRRRGWSDRVLPRQLHSSAQSALRLDEAGGRERYGDRVAWPSFGRRVAESAQSGERMALQ